MPVQAPLPVDRHREGAQRPGESVSAPAANRAGGASSALPALFGRAALEAEELIARNRRLETKLAATRKQADDTVGDYAREIERWRTFAVQAGACAAKVGGDLAAMTRHCEEMMARALLAEGKVDELERAARAAAEERRAREEVLAMVHEHILAVFGVGSRFHDLTARLEPVAA